MVQYSYEGILTNDVAEHIFRTLQELPFVIETTDSPEHQWFLDNLKKQTVWRESDNWSGGVDRYATEDVRYVIAYKTWNQRDAHNNILGNRFIFTNNEDDDNTILRWALDNQTLVAAQPFRSLF